MIAPDAVQLDGLDVESLDPAPFAIGRTVPAQAFAARSDAAVAAVLAQCDRAGAAVVIFGNGTLQSIGNAPERYDVALTLRRLNAIAEYEPRDLTVSAGAGMTVAALRERLARDRLFVPLDVPEAARTTLGGVLASGWLGPRRTVYGRPRDVVIGSTIALADGTLAHAGGMVVKNVTGYDMSKLYIGSLGTLGALVRVNFKTLPLPECRRSALAPISTETYGRAIAMLGHLTVEPACVLSIEGFAGATPGLDAPSRLFVRFDGTRAGVDRATREMRSALGAAGVASTKIVDENADETLDAILDAHVEAVGERSVTYRIPGLVASAPARYAWVYEAGRANELDVETIVDHLSGDLFARFCAASADALLDAIAQLDGTLRAQFPSFVIAGGMSARRSVDAWGAPPSSFAVMRSIKTSFDPRATLSPGRFVGGL